MQKKVKKVVQIQPIIDELKDEKIPFTLETTTLTRKVITPDFTYSYINKGAGLNLWELNLIKAVKRDALAINIDNFPKVTAEDVPYINRNPKRFGSCLTFEDMYEVDLNQAYWNLAYINGIITEATFLKAAHPRISKGARLIALGALAKRTRVIEFDGTQYGKLYEGERLTTERLFYFCCEEVASIMIDFAQLAGDDFLFYWVDAIFLKGPAVQKVIENLIAVQQEIKIKFPSIPDSLFKMYKIDKIIIEKSCFIVYSQQHKTKKRPFNFQKVKQKINL
jgi:hypothetical protein